MGCLGDIRSYSAQCHTQKTIISITLLVTVIYLSTFPYPIFDRFGTVEYYIPVVYEQSQVSLGTSGNWTPFGGSDKLLPPCQLYSHTLKSDKIRIPASPALISDIIRANPLVQNGGFFYPGHCRPIQRVAIIIPYKDRWDHLLHLLTFLHPMLQRQDRHYGVFVVEQANDGVFNKGRLMNTAYREALKMQAWDCVIFHDVDMIPESDFNLYMCGMQPLHMSPGVNEMRYTLMYSKLVGGVLALQPRHFEAANGYSNIFWGWGGEDDNMALRLGHSGFNITQPSNHVGKYKMVFHTKRKGADNRMQLLRDHAREHSVDGLNSLSATGARVLSVTAHALYTNISVNVGSPPTVPAEQRKTWSENAWKKILDFLTPMFLGI